MGRFRYKQAPQGLIASGDALNNRLDAILAEFENKERLMDEADAKRKKAAAQQMSEIRRRQNGKTS